MRIQKIGLNILIPYSLIKMAGEKNKKESNETFHFKVYKPILQIREKETIILNSHMLVCYFYLTQVFLMHIAYII